MKRVVIAAGCMFFISRVSFADAPAAASPAPLLSPSEGLPALAVPASPPGTPASLMESPPPVETLAPRGEVPWCKSPYANSAWRVEFDLIPTVSHVAEPAFGDWSDNGTVALRLSLGYEGDDGFGTRLAFWGMGQEASTLVGDVELDASTFYWDFYKRFFIQDAELTLGGGLAGAHLLYDVKAHFVDAEARAGGLSIFGEGFYPLWKFERTDIGSVGRARLALLSGQWRDHGTPFVNDADNDMMTIFELGWGLELRHRFGRQQEKYWYIDLVPELQRWESSTLADVCEPGFDGTNIRFGLAW